MFHKKASWDPKGGQAVFVWRRRGPSARRFHTNTDYVVFARVVGPSDRKCSDEIGFWWNWFVMGMVFDESGLWWNWFLMKLVFDESGFWWKWFLMKVVFDESGILMKVVLWWNCFLMKVVFDESGFWWKWILMKIFFWWKWFWWTCTLPQCQLPSQISSNLFISPFLDVLDFWIDELICCEWRYFVVLNVKLTIRLKLLFDTMIEIAFLWICCFVVFTLELSRMYYWFVTWCFFFFRAISKQERLSNIHFHSVCKDRYHRWIPSEDILHTRHVSHYDKDVFLSSIFASWCTEKCFSRFVSESMHGLGASNDLGSAKEGHHLIWLFFFYFVSDAFFSQYSRWTHCNKHVSFFFQEKLNFRNDTKTLCFVDSFLHSRRPFLSYCETDWCSLLSSELNNLSDFHSLSQKYVT